MTTRHPRARPPVRVTINNHNYRSTVAVYGGRYFRRSTSPIGRRLASPPETWSRWSSERMTRLAQLTCPMTWPRLSRGPGGAGRVPDLSLVLTPTWTRRAHRQAKRPETRQRRIERTLDRLR